MGTPLIANVNLSGITISTGVFSPAFSAGNTSYSISEGNEVSSITLSPIAADPTAIITVNGVSVTSGAVSGPISIPVGRDTILVQVTTPDGSTTNAYTLVVTRAETVEADLSNLSVSQGTLSPAFNPDSLNYTAKVSIVKKDHTIYTIGDSITANGEYQLSLSSLLKGQFYFIDPAIYGAYTSIMLDRFTMVTNAAPDYVIILGGINDLDHLAGANSKEIENNLQAMYTAAHSAGSKVVAITITPDKGNPNWSTVRQAQQDSVNTWLHTAQNVDYLIDGYSTLVDPANPYQLLPAYDSGDHLHPNKAGQDALAAAIYAGAQFTPNPAIDQLNAANSSVTVTPVAGYTEATTTVNGTVVPSGAASAPILIAPGANTIVTHVTAPDGAAKNYTINLTGLPSNNANLANITTSVTGNTLTPVFDPNITSYTASVPHDSTTVRVKLSAIDSNATVTLNGLAVKSDKAPLMSLNVGPNMMSIVVTAADKLTQKTYTLNEIRVYSTNADLEVMKPSAGGTSPDFSSIITSYTSSVSTATASITITPGTADPNATVTVNGVPTVSGAASSPIALVIGPNIINTVVTAQDGYATKTYMLTVTRLPSTNAYLEEMKPSAGDMSPYFSSSTYTYAGSVSYATSSITIIPRAADTNVTITVNGNVVAQNTASPAIPLAVGENTITTIVTAQDGITRKTYTLIETRVAPSGNSELSRLEISAGTLSPAFATNTASYRFNEPNSITSITVTPTAADAGASITINGTAVASGKISNAIVLNVGTNVLKILVTAEDGVSTSTYTLTIDRAAAADINGDSGSIVVHQGVSPNGDGIDDFLQIDNIEKYPDNNIRVITRYGALVYQAAGYDNATKIFDGHDSKNGLMLLAGVYFYELDYTYNGVLQRKLGFLVLKY